MLSTKLNTVLDKNADFWSMLTSRGGNIPFFVIIVVLIIYHFAIVVTLMCACAGGSMVADRVATDPALQDQTWIVPIVFFCITLLNYAWVVAVLGIIASFLLGAYRHTKRLRHPEGT